MVSVVPARVVAVLVVLVFVVSVRLTFLCGVVGVLVRLLLLLEFLFSVQGSLCVNFDGDVLRLLESVCG